MEMAASDGDVLWLQAALSKWDAAEQMAKDASKMALTVAKMRARLGRTRAKNIDGLRWRALATPAQIADATVAIREHTMQAAAAYFASHALLEASYKEMDELQRELASEEAAAEMRINCTGCGAQLDLDYTENETKQSARDQAAETGTPLEFFYQHPMWMAVHCQGAAPWCPW